MTEAEIMDYYPSVISDERKHVAEHRAEFFVTTYLAGAPELANSMFRAPNPAYDLYLGRTVPRIALKFLSSALFKIDALRESGTNAEPLKQVVNGLILPMTGVPMAQPSARAVWRDTESATYCQMAEKYFTAAVNQTEGMVKDPHSSLAVYHTGEGLPLLFQKSRDIPSALTLEAVDIGGVVFPAGTIVGISNDPTDFSEKSGALRDCEVKSYEVGNTPLQLEPGRLSPWAYSEKVDQALFAVGANRKRNPETGYCYDPNRADMIIMHSIDDFRMAAGRVMNLCGVEAIGPRQAASS